MALPESVSGRLLEMVYYVVQFFKEEKEHKSGINITAVTSEATRVSEILMNMIPEEGNGSTEKEELCLSTPKWKKKHMRTISTLSWISQSDLC